GSTRHRVDFGFWQLALLFLGAKIGGTIFGKLRQPSLIGELLAGTILGTILLDLGTSTMIQVVAQIGIVFLILYTMMSIDLSAIEQDIERLVLSQALTAVIIFALLTGIFSWLNRGTGEISFILVAGAAIFGSSTVITARVLLSLREMDSREGQAIIGLQIINSIVELLLISSVSNILKYQQFNYEPVLSLALMVIGTFAVMSRVGSRFINGLLNSVQVLKMDEVFLALTLLLAFTIGAVTEALQLTSYLGVMLVGVLISRTEQAKAISTKIRELGEGFFIPIFFGYLGLSVSILGVLADVSWLITLLVLLTIVRFAAGFVPTLFTGYSISETVKIASGMLPMSEYGLLMLSLGVTYGVLTQVDYSVFVVIFLVVNVLSPLAITLLFRGTPVTPHRRRSPHW
ncbi:MAG: cation:proton antiporter, partial [Methanomicrobiales archaeon]|nr:cation:proton antiporter [Methanomicrobiales archaeon]